MLITTKKTLCGQYIVFATYGAVSFAGHSKDRSTAFSIAIRDCYKFIERLKNEHNR